MAFLHVDLVLQTQNLNSAVLSPDGSSADLLREVIFQLVSIISTAIVGLQSRVLTSEKVLFVIKSFENVEKFQSLN